jgi:large repetitive protein
MTHKPNHFARKKRQLHFLVKKLQDVLIHGKDASEVQIKMLISKIQRIVDELTYVVSQMDLKRMLGAVAIYIGVSFPNQASAQSFSSPQLNPFGITATYTLAAPVFADLDGDGDLDLLVGEGYGSIQYYENTGTASEPQFAAPLNNPFGIDSAYYIAFPALADLDGDGDLDLLVGEYNDDYYYGGMQYYENVGSATNPQFAEPQLNPFGLTRTYYWAFPTFADLDGDGDTDLLVGEYYGALQYFENIGSASNPQFAAPQVNPFGLDSINSIVVFPTLSDLDEDGDLDLLVGVYGDDGLMQYYENTGSSSNPQFASPQINPFGLVSTDTLSVPTFVDLDDDGDFDLLVGEYDGNMQYFENTGTSATEMLSENFDLTLFPNPVSNVLTLLTEEKITRIAIFNALGQAVGVTEKINNKIYLNNLTPGLYLVKFINTEGHYAIRKIQKQ